MQGGNARGDDAKRRCGRGQRSGPGRRRQRRPRAAAAPTRARAVVTATTMMSSWSGQGVVAVAAVAAAVTRMREAAATVVGLLRQTSGSNHSRGRRLLSFFSQMTAMVQGGSLPLL